MDLAWAAQQPPSHWPSPAGSHSISLKHTLSQAWKAPHVARGRCFPVVVAPCLHAIIVAHAVGGVLWQQRSRAVPRVPVMLRCGLLGHTWYLRNRNCLLSCQSYEAVAITHSLPAQVSFVHVCVLGTHSTYEILAYCSLRYSPRVVPGCTLCLELLQRCNVVHTLAHVATWASYKGT